ncbi:hypothetical protein JOF37_002568 [Microbacterium imperiale]|nr:hypothetical protein [Microbacterium imperiale]
MGFILALQTLENSDDEHRTILVSAASSGICRSTVSTLC